MSEGVYRIEPETILAIIADDIEKLLCSGCNNPEGKELQFVGCQACGLEYLLCDDCIDEDECPFHGEDFGEDFDGDPSHHFFEKTHFNGEFHVPPHTLLRLKEKTKEEDSLAALRFNDLEEWDE